MVVRCSETPLRMLVRSCLVLYLFVACANSVSRDNFKTCDQSGFCKRHRKMQAGESPYVANLESLKVHTSNVDIQLLNKKTNVQLLLQVFALEDNTFRFKINEMEPLRPRYEVPVGDSLVKEPEKKQLVFKGKESKQVIVGLGQTEIIIREDPFRVEVMVDDEPVVLLNAQGLLKFEHQRKKEGWFSRQLSSLYSWFSTPFRQQPPAPEDKPAEVEDKDAEEEVKEEEDKPAQEEEPDMWDETFKTFHDSKPYGPMSVGMDVAFPGFEFVYGIPEHAETLALKTTKSTDPYRLFNLDVFEYELYNPMALYGSVPIMIAHNEKRTVGVLWLNAAETWVDVSSNIADKSFFNKLSDLVKGSQEVPQTDTHWFSESGIIDIFVMLGPTPRDVFHQYARLTGTTVLPPLFGMAYHQCRWNYNDEDDVKNVAENMDKIDIPFDVIWLDIEHTDGKRYFTWAKDKFPHPVEMQGNLSSRGRKLVTIVDPHLKRDDNYAVYAEAKNKGYLIKNKDGNDYEGWCWPGSSSWPDFCNPEVQSWWADKFAFSQYEGTTKDLHVWNDMNEASVFNGPEITFHKDIVHHGGFENRDVHNIYAYYVHKATWEGLLKRSDHKQRPFVLTRGFFVGSQRYGAVWTGDNMADWGHLKVSVPMVLTLNLAGITFSGADVGGFFHNPDNELLTRWYELGAFYPFFRAHAHQDTKRREPYLLPEENMLAVKKAIRTRYSFLPFWYTRFYTSEREGGPLMVPLWVEYPQDKRTFNMDDQFLVGSALLVKPVTEQGHTSVNVFFPGEKDVWYDIETYQAYPGGREVNVPAPLDKIPVYQRSGTIVPRKMRVRRSSALMHQDPITLIVCLDAEGKARGDLFVDDYTSFQYKNGAYIYRGFEFENNRLQSVNYSPNSRYTTKEWVEKIVILGVQQQPAKVALVLGGDMKALDSKYDKQKSMLTIRKPGVNVGEDWSVILK